MKKILSYLFIASLFFTACNPMDDIYDELDQKEIANKQDGIEYTITADDYESMGDTIKTNNYFSERTPSANYIPSVLASLYPTFTSGSTVKVTYNYKNESSYLDTYGEAKKYTLTDDDYASISETVGDAGYFSPSNSPDDNIPVILSNSVTDAQSGDYYIISYKYSDIDPEEKPNEQTEVTILEETFTSDLGAFNSVSVSGDQKWGFASYKSSTYAKISGFSGGSNHENEDWLISNAIDLSGLSSLKLNVTQAANYLSSWDQLKLLVSTDYDGSNPSTATWTELTFPAKPTGNNWDFVESGDIDLSDFSGKTIFIGFKYLSSTSGAATWEISDIILKGTTATTTAKSSIIAGAITIDELYTYNSGWKKPTGVYYLTSADYDAMGEEYNKPGKYNNFSSSIRPRDYLPQLATQKYPYAQQNDTTIFVYKYYNGDETINKADELYFLDGKWQVVFTKTDQYALAASGWVFDPTVNYTMTKDDYQIIVDYVAENFTKEDGSSYVSKYGNNEYYFGSNAHYGEFQTTGYFEKKVFEKWEEAAQEAIGTAFLPNKFPDAVTQVDGVDMFYAITFAAYINGSMVNHTIRFQCIKSAPNPEFEFIELNKD